VAASEPAAQNGSASLPSLQASAERSSSQQSEAVSTGPTTSKEGGLIENKTGATLPPDARVADAPTDRTLGHAAVSPDKTTRHADLHDPAGVFAAPGGNNAELDGLSRGTANIGRLIPTISEPTIASPSMPTVHSAHLSAGAALERMDAAVAPQVMESTPQRLTVGVHNAGLGWMEIRTSTAAGQVSATLTTGSPESHGALAAQLPAVREYLAGEQIHIDHLAAERFSQSAGERGSSSGDPSQNEGARHQTSLQQQSSRGMSSVGFSSADVDPEGLSYINVRV
jgi:flagellar hook-length control protein FliK